MFRPIAKAVGAALTLALLALAVPAQADVFLSAEFGLARGEDEGSYEFTASVPEASATSNAIGLPDGCTQTGSARQTAGGRTRYAFDFSCSRALRTTDTIQTPWRVDGGSFVTNVMGVQVDRSLSGSDDGIAVPIGETAATERPLPQIAREYLGQGIVHIWMGWDHLAFVLCLCLLASGRELLGLVTAFTAGHSISLALAFFELVSMPIPPVEAAIALSIAFMAREALFASGRIEDRRTLRRHLVVVSLFGLLHGLGFASALGELGVSPGERASALVFFNMGVEFGQLMFVALVSGVMLALRRVSLAQPVREIALYGTGAIGAFWMIERVVGFGVA